MNTNPARTEAAIAEIDALHSGDPRTEDGRPAELVYAERMTACLNRLYPDAAEALIIAARGQHLCRWEIARADYPIGRQGYNAWRIACRVHHADLVTGIMQRLDFPADTIARAGKIIRKEELKRDPDSQALENVAAVVFAEHYLAAFVADHADYDDARLADILKKTLRKMDGTGHEAVLALTFPPEIQRAVALAVA
jgi:hypothetical protein